MGEKERYRKFSLWDDSTHVPLIIRLPPSTKTKWAKGQRCDEAVSLHDIFPTLMELVGMQPPQELDGVSLVPQLIDASTRRAQGAVTVNDWNTAYAVRTEQWTYIQREDGEELYDRPRQRPAPVAQPRQRSPASRGDGCASEADPR